MEIQHQLFRTYDIQLSAPEYQAFIGRSSKNMWQELIQRFSLKVTVEEVLHQDRSLYHSRLRNEPGLAPIPGVRELIEELLANQIRLALASSSSMQSIELVLELLDLATFFDPKVSGADLQYSKPHPEIFLVTAGITQTQEKRCLVIEDSNHGVTAAKSAKMKCIGFRNPNSGDQNLSHADLIIDDFSSLSHQRIMELGVNHC
jgi:HAD superfamily hydrolase (TIGR01509 family)